MKNYQFNSQSFGDLFPFFLLLGSKEEVLDYGPAWNKLKKMSEVKFFYDKFELIRPGNRTRIAELDLKSKAPVIFKRKKDGQLFRGMFEAYNDQFLFMGTPWYADVEDLIKSGLTMNDFAAHDATIELLHALKQRDINNAELANILKQSNEQKDQLKKEEAERLHHEKMLQTLADCAEELLTNVDIEEAIQKTTLKVAESVNSQGVFFFHCEQQVDKLTFYQKKDAYRFEINPTRFNDILNINSVLNLDELNQNEFINHCLSLGINRLSIFEVKQGKQCTGALFFALPEGKSQWAESEKSLLRSFTNNIGSALSNEVSKIALEQMAQFPMQSPDPVLRINKKGEIILRNPAAESIHSMLIEDELWDEKDFYVFVAKEVQNSHKLLKLEGQHLGSTYQITAIPTYDQAYINIYLHDISDRKLAELKLQKQEEKYRNIIANMNLGLIEVDLNDNVIYANQSFCDMCGYTLDEIKGKSASKILTEGANEEIIQRKNSMRAEGVADMYEVQIKKKNGELADWLISGAPSYNDQGEPIGSIGIHLDITSHKVMEKDLYIAKTKAEESARYKESFLANMSHEIRTPLNAIIGMIREMMRDYHSEKQGLYLKNADRASKHLLSIVNDILDLSKIEAGQLELEQRDFNLQQLFDDCGQIVSPMLREKLLDFTIQVDPDLNLWYIGDEIRIRQVLLNLLNNAVKFTSEGSIVFSCELTQKKAHSDVLTIKIKDTGIGMDKEFTENLFQKFVQADISVGRKYGGTGLGMAITRELLQLMNGRIDVKSEKNQGSEFFITLELGHGDPRSAIIQDTASISSISRGKNILLVEDNELNRLVTSNSLEVLGIKVVEAENGLEAIHILKEKPHFDLILMDLQMPVMDGLEASRKIREELQLNIPILALTANAFKSVLEKCQEAGMQDFITKPFEEKTFFEKLRLYLNQDELDITPELQNIQSSTKSSLFSLHKLEELSRGNNEFIEKMLEMFLDLTPQQLDEIEKALHEKDRQKLSKTVHKIRPSLQNLAVDLIEKDLVWIETNAKETDWYMIEEKTLFCVDHIRKVLVEIDRGKESRFQH